MLEQAHDFTVPGEFPEGLFRKDQRVVDRDLVHAPARGDHLAVDVKLLFEFSRQTGGARFVVSNLAKLDRDFHGPLQKKSGGHRTNSLALYQQDPTA